MGLGLMLFELSTLGSAAAIGAALVYALVRPRDDPRARLEHRLRLRLLERELVPDERCLSCLTAIEEDFRCCPGCGEPLRVECEGCGELLAIGWGVCPWCLAQTTIRRNLRPAEVAA